MGGAMFGDNLSFISDTTIAACSTQGCEMKDKFRTNFRIALPAALVTLALIIVFSLKSDIGAVEISEYHLLQTVPYLLVLIGGNMIREALSGDEEDAAQAETDLRLDHKKLFLMAIATSIDALAIGVTFAFLETAILPAIGIIGCTTFCISVAGVAVGCWFGARYKKRAEITGGVILVLLGCKILLEHLGLLSF